MTPDERIAALVRLGYRVDVRDRGHDWRVYARTREEAVASAHEHVTRVPA